MKKRLAIYIDGRSFLIGARGRSIYWWKLDRWFEDKFPDHELVCVRMYIGRKRDRRGKRPRRLTLFREVPKHTLVERPVAKSGKEVGIDTQLALDVLEQTLTSRKHGSGIDTLILITCDGDHAPTIEKLQEYGVRVFVSSWGQGGYFSSYLTRIADGYIDLHHGVMEFSSMTRNERLVLKALQDATRTGEVKIKWFGRNYRHEAINQVTRQQRAEAVRGLRRIGLLNTKKRKDGAYIVNVNCSPAHSPRTASR